MIPQRRDRKPNVFGYNLAGDYPSNMGVDSLTTLPVNLAFATDTELEFQRWLGVDASLFDHASIADQRRTASPGSPSGRNPPAR